MAEAERQITISVVIPLFNKESAIECTLRSVLRQTRQPDEVIVVDDGSTDRSASVVKRLLEAEPTKIPVRLLEQANQGVSVARNHGADQARSDFIAFLDADDEWLPDCVAEFERLARAFSEATVLTVLLARSSPNGPLPFPSPLPPGFFGELTHPLRVYRKGYGLIQSSNVAIRRDAWWKLGGFPVGAQSGEDIAAWLKLMTTERLAHSGKAGSVWHQEHSGAAARRGSVPYHFSHFLADPDGRRYLANPDLVRFLASNLAVHIGGHRLALAPTVVSELRRLSTSLPSHLRAAPLAASIAPLWVLRILRRWRSGAARRE